MALRSSVQHDPLPEPDGALLAAVLHYQQLYQAWLAEADTAQRAVLRAALHACQEVLWSLLAEPLVRVAHGWLRSGMARDMWANPTSYPGREDVIRSLAMNMYIHIVDALPQLRIDPQKNLLACLKTIATWGMFDEQQRIYRDGRHQPSGQVDATSARDTHMWPARKSADVPLSDDQDAADLADPQSIDFGLYRNCRGSESGFTALGRPGRVLLVFRSS